MQSGMQNVATILRYAQAQPGISNDQEIEGGARDCAVAHMNSGRGD